MTKRSEVAKHLFKEDIADNFQRRITGGFWNTDPSYPYKPHIGVDYGANIGEELIAYDDYEVIGINTGTGEFINAPKSFEITHVDLVERND